MLLSYQSVKTVTNYSLYLRKNLLKYIEQQTGTVQQHKSTDNIPLADDADISSDQQQKKQNKKKDKNKNQDKNKNKTQQQMQQLAQDFGFQMDIDQPANVPSNSLTTYQFWNGLFGPDPNISNKNSNKKQQNMTDMRIQLQLQQCFGYNSQQKYTCIILDINCYCFAIGCNLILCPLSQKQRKLPYKRYEMHNQQITHIQYSAKYKTIITGTKGHRPQIIIWKYIADQIFQQIDIKFMKKIRLPINTQGIQLIRHINQNQIICVDWISIHRSSSLYWFNIKQSENSKDKNKDGEKVYKMKQRLQKIFDVVVVDQKKQKYLYVLSNNYLYKSNINKSSNQQFTKISINKNNIKPISFAIFNKNIYIGDSKGNITVTSQKGQIILQQKIHLGLIFIVFIIPQKSLLFTTGAIDNFIKIHTIIQSQKQKDKISLKLKLLKTLQLPSYCTSLSAINQQNILIGCRDGTIMLYDMKNKIKKYQKLNTISCQQRKHRQIIYNKSNDRIVFTTDLNKLIQILPVKCQNVRSNKMEFIVQKTLKRILNCATVYNQMMLQIFPIAQKKYRVQIISQIQISKKQKQLQFFIQIQLKQQGKPKIAKLNQQYAVIGTKNGYLIICNLATKDIIRSEKHHSKQIQDIIFQLPAQKNKKQIYIKTVSGSQLFYWEVNISQKNPKIKKIEKAQPVKNLTWCNLSKYCWETRKIWEKMTHYQDIQSVALINQKLLCVAMYDGTLRIYKSFRMNQKTIQFQQYKLFTGKFNVLSCGKSQDTLICQKNCQFYLFKIKLQKK